MEEREQDNKRLHIGRLRRWLLIGLGAIALGLGILGIFVPLLPTTPFLLLAAAAFVRSSEKLHDWLLNHRWFGTYIRNYREHRAITLRAKVLTLTMLWSTIGYAIIAVVEQWWVRGLLLLIAAGVTLHITRLKTFKA